MLDIDVIAEITSYLSALAAVYTILDIADMQAERAQHIQLQNAAALRRLTMAFHCHKCRSLYGTTTM
jgi:hypothetical protein